MLADGGVVPCQDLKFGDIGSNLGVEESDLVGWVKIFVRSGRLKGPGAAIGPPM